MNAPSTPAKLRLSDFIHERRTSSSCCTQTESRVRRHVDNHCIAKKASRMIFFRSTCRLVVAALWLPKEARRPLPLRHSGLAVPEAQIVRGRRRSKERRERERERERERRQGTKGKGERRQGRIPTGKLATSKPPCHQRDIVQPLWGRVQAEGGREGSCCVQV